MVTPTVKMAKPPEKSTHTLAEYREWCDRPENADRLFELIDGEIIEKVASYTPSRIGMRIGHLISSYLDTNPIGDVTGADGTYEMSETNAFMPDVAFISRTRMPDDPERAAQIPPDLAVEVKSPTDTYRALRKKAELYLASGTRIVWLVFPETETVELYMGNADVQVMDVTKTLEGGEVLPGFILPVREIFKRWG
ncbi:MAG: Uma2 family endonuclease [Aggregatilineales bacterium]